MTITSNKKIVLTAVMITLMMLVGAGSALGAPIKLQPVQHIAGFEFPESVAVSPNGNIYVSDSGQNRIRELTPTGEPVLMFGWDVNKTKVEASAPQSERNVCTVVSLDVCQTGVKGTAAGQFNEAYSLAVDPSSGAVYVEELVTGNYRVDKYTAEGQFVWMVGREVNKKTKGDICVAVDEASCGAGLESTAGSTVPLEFKFASDRGDLLAVGGPGKLLYVGDEQRVQEINTEGESKAEILPVAFDTETGCNILVEGCRVTGLAVDAAGSVYLSDNAATLSPVARVRVFPHEGKEETIEVHPRHEGGETKVNAIAIDDEGRLAVTAYESGAGPFGIVYETGVHLGHALPEFKLFPSSNGITFDNNVGVYHGYLFGVDDERVGEVIAYKPEPVAELIPNPMSCLPGTAQETDATLDCTLNGEVNPENVPKTEVWFEWGRTSELGEKTPVQPIATGNTLVPVSAEVGVVRPNEAGFYFRLAAHDERVEPPEVLTSDKVQSTTPIVAPVIVGAPSVLFVKAASAVMVGELNPENAKTKFFFEYGQGEALAHCSGVLNGSCAGVATTTAEESSVYGKISTNLEARSLQAETIYHYRLAAESENGAKTEKQQSLGPEGSFVTAPAPKVRAISGSASAVTAISAIVSGTVDPDGQPAAYTFKLGVYAGSATQYGIVLSGLVEGTGPAERSLVLTGLQPGTAYAYKITIANGYGEAESGPVTFTTLSLPTVVPVPTLVAMLPVPKFRFPPPQKPLPKCKAKLVRDKRGKCVKAKKKGGKSSRRRARTRNK